MKPPQTVPTPAPPRMPWKRGPRQVKTTAERIMAQEQRAQMLTFVLGAALVCQSILLLGSAGVWAMSAALPPGTEPAQAQAVSAIAPYARLVVVYTVTLMALTSVSRRATLLRRPQARAWTLGTLAVMFLGIPFGTLIAPLILLVLPPRRWLDARPKTPTG